MSGLNLRLPSPKKVWRSFTSKLQSKLRKLTKSKNIKKSRHTFNSSSKSVPITPSVLFYHSKKRRLFNPFKPHKSRKHLFLRKKSSPVYIDKLFSGPVATDQELVVKFPPRVKTMKVAELANKGEGEGSERGGQADTKWESLGFASPQMRGIDERAEQFIASFRAEMEIQEIIACNLSNENDSS